MPSSRPVIRLRNAVLHGFTRALIWLVRVQPMAWSYAMGRNLALFAWNIMPNWRRNASRNIELFFHGISPHPSEDPAWRLRVGRQAAIGLGYHVVEFMMMGTHDPEAMMKMVVEEQGADFLRRRLAESAAQGKGVILVSLHYGNWELCGAWLAREIGVLNAVGKEQRDEFFTNIAFPWRARFGIRNITVGNKVSSALLRALKEGQMLGLISDQNGGKAGTFAPFGARRETAVIASNAAGAAALALRTGSPAILGYLRRLRPGEFKAFAGPEIDLSNIPGHDPATGRYTDEALVEAIARINAGVAAVIEADPTQWLWGHKRWKTRPPGEPWLY